MKTIKVGSDFSGVGAFNQALTRLGIEYQEVYACDMDKYARQTFIHNYGEPKYYPLNVYDREIPSESLDIYMTSPPCQAFSMAGKRLGKEDKRGILFFNSLEFIQVNKPRFFIFENVKGLLSDDGGKTFSEWVNMLGGKSVNGNPVIFAYDDSVPYHLYWKVLNAKEHGVPQNRERVFLIGIKDDQDNTFRWPVEEHLTKRLKDVLEEKIDDKYFLSYNQIENIIKSEFTQEKTRIQDGNYSGTLLSRDYKSPKCVKVKSGRAKGYDEALDTECNQGVICGAIRGRGENNKATLELNSENYSNAIITSQTANLIIDKECNQGVISYTRDSKGKVVSRHINQQANTIHTATGGGGNTDQFVIYNDKRLNETIAKNTLKEGEIKILDTYNQSIHDECPTLKKHHAENGDRKLWDGYRIRRLTPRECFRLMDFPDTFTWPVSDSQAYKQAGNSIVVRVLEKIIKNLPL